MILILEVIKEVADEDAWFSRYLMHWNRGLYSLVIAAMR